MKNKIPIEKFIEREFDKEFINKIVIPISLKIFHESTKLYESRRFY